MIADSATMLRRNLRHMLRDPSALILSLGIPVLLLLLFVGVFGGALAASLPGPGHYVDYLLPGILLMTVGYGSSTTATSVNRDMTEGIISRFRTMAISRSAVLTGHVIGALIRTMISAGLVIVFSLLMGFRPTTDPLRWLGALGVLALFVLALTWIAVAVGLLARNAEGTGPFILVVQTLPFLSSAFIRPDSMSAPVRWFARNEPFSPVIDAVRNLLSGAPAGADALVAVAWCVGLALFGYLWSRRLFQRE
jgi:ABC-2 type transport system permease protein